MHRISLPEKILRYAKVGIFAALVHFSLQLLMGLFLPLWISNTFGFFVASIVSYLGHSIYTYRFETQGRIFSKYWLFFQFTVNIILSAFLPFFLSALNFGFSTRIILVLTPIVMNALIWSKAAKYTIRLY